MWYLFSILLLIAGCNGIEEPVYNMGFIDVPDSLMRYDADSFYAFQVYATPTDTIECALEYQLMDWVLVRKEIIPPTDSLWIKELYVNKILLVPFRLRVKSKGVPEDTVYWRRK